MPESAQGSGAQSDAIADLVVGRQRLRDCEAGHGELEANTLELARLQQQLAVAVIGRHCSLSSDRGAA
jgi:hypothetical protein